MLEPLLVVKSVGGTKVTLFKRVRIITLGDLRILPRDPEKRVRVMSLAKGIGMITMNNSLEETDLDVRDHHLHDSASKGNLE